MKVLLTLLTLLATHTDNYIWGFDSINNNPQSVLESKQIVPWSPLTLRKFAGNVEYTINFSILPHSFPLKDSELLEPFNLNLVIGDTFVIGLDKIIAKVSIENTYQEFSISLISSDMMKLTGKYKANGFYKNPEKIKKNVLGSGNYTIAFNGLKGNYKGQIMSSKGVQIKQTSMSLSFDSAELFAENFTIDGVLLEWSNVNDLLNSHFEGIWSFIHEQIIGELEKLCNNKLKDFTLDEILEQMSFASKGWLYFKMSLVRFCPLCSAFINSLQIFSYKIPG